MDVRQLCDLIDERKEDTKTIGAYILKILG